MCEVIVDDKGTYDYVFSPEEIIIKTDNLEILRLIIDDDVCPTNTFFEKGGKLYCRHPDVNPDDPWHEMTIKPGEVLHCPANTELKLVVGV